MTQFPELQRRTFLTGAAATATGWLASSTNSQAGPQLQVPIWTREQGGPIVSPPYGVPSRFEDGIVRRPRATPPVPTAAATNAPTANSSRKRPI